MTELLKHSLAGNYLADSCQPIAVSDISDLQNKPICGLTIIFRAPPQVSSRSVKCRAHREDIDRLFTRKFVQPRKLVVDPLAHLSLLADVRIIHLDPAKMEYAAQDDISHEVR